MIGVVLYNPGIYYRLLLNQYPKLFFDGNIDEDAYKDKGKDKKKIYNKILLEEEALEK